MASKIKSASVKVKRIYEPRDRSDGTRILVDRLWPRGLSKEKASIDEWMKDVAPSDALRKSFGHDPDRWSEFRARYRAELKSRPEGIKRLRALARRGTITLVYSAHDERHNNAVALRNVLLK